METAGTVIALAGALLFGRFAWVFLSKEKYPTSVLFGIITAVFLLCSLPWFQGFLKTWVVSNVNSKLTALGGKVDDVQKTIGDMQSDLQKHQTQIDTNQIELGVAQTDIRLAQTNLTAQQKELTGQHSNLNAMQFQLAGAQTNLQTQEKQLGDVKYWVENIYDNVKAETFKASDTNRCARAKTEGGGWRYIFLLNHVPIANSLHGFITGHGFANQGEKTILVIPNALNLVTCVFYGYDDATFTFNVQYVADKRETNLFRGVIVKGTNFFIGDKVIDFMK